MVGICFSGTGNTRHCVERFVQCIENTAKSFSIEDKNVADEIINHEIIVFGFPIYYSNIPKIAKDFITKNKACFKGKKIFIITTKGIFNAFAVGYAKRIFEKYGANFIGSLQLNMPNNIHDLFITEVVFSKKYNKIINKADRKILKASEKFKEKIPTKSGLNPFNYLIGFVLKMLWFYPKTDKYISAPTVNIDKCNGCGKCVKNCPTRNISLKDGKALSADKCTICYRCFSICPQKALTILGNNVYNQYLLHDVKK